MGVILTMLDKPYSQFFLFFILGMRDMQNKSYLQGQHTTSFISEVREIKNIKFISQHTKPNFIYGFCEDIHQLIFYSHIL